MSEELDTAVFSFLENEISEGRYVRNKDLQERAMELAATMDLSEFKASCQCVSRWKKCWNVGDKRGTNYAQCVPADYCNQLSEF